MNKRKMTLISINHRKSNQELSKRRYYKNQLIISERENLKKKRLDGKHSCKNREIQMQCAGSEQIFKILAAAPISRIPTMLTTR